MFWIKNIKNFDYPIDNVDVYKRQPHEVAHGSLRLTIAEDITEEQIDYMVKEIKNVVDYLRSISPVWDELQRGEQKHVI